MSRPRPTNSEFDTRSLGHERDIREPFSRSCPVLVKPQSRPSLSRAEQHFSTYAQRQLLRLLSGKCKRFRLMRHFYDANKIGFFLPSRLNKADVSVGVAEDIIFGVLQFLHPFGMGSPIEQRSRGDKFTETQLFSTRYPHLLIRRQNRYDKPGHRLIVSDWQVVSVHRTKSALLEGAVELRVPAIDVTKFLPAL